jgi:hypothetical protein
MRPASPAPNSYNRAGGGGDAAWHETCAVGRGHGAMRLRSWKSRGSQPRCTSTARAVAQAQRRHDVEAGPAVHLPVVEVDGVRGRPAPRQLHRAVVLRGRGVGRAGQLRRADQGRQAAALVDRRLQRGLLRRAGRVARGPTCQSAAPRPPSPQ